MPLRLVPPRAGKSPNWTVRGHHLGINVDKSAGTGDRKLAAKILARIRAGIECGAYAVPGAPTFASAALEHMQAGGEKKFLAPLLRHFGDQPGC